MHDRKFNLLAIIRETGKRATLELKEGQRRRQCILQKISADCCSVIKVEELNGQLTEVKYQYEAATKKIIMEEEKLKKQRTENIRREVVEASRK